MRRGGGGALAARLLRPDLLPCPHPYTPPRLLLPASRLHDHGRLEVTVFLWGPHSCRPARWRGHPLHVVVAAAAAAAAMCPDPDRVGRQRVGEGLRGFRRAQVREGFQVLGIALDPWSLLAYPHPHPPHTPIALRSLPPTHTHTHHTRPLVPTPTPTTHTTHT